MTQPSGLKVTQQGSVTLVAFGEASILDMFTIQKIGRELYDLLESQGHKRVVLDFGDVRFLSSQALGVLLTLRKKADKAAAQVAVSGVKPELERVFRITNLDKMFQFFKTSAEAVAGLSQ